MISVDMINLPFLKRQKYDSVKMLICMLLSTHRFLQEVENHFYYRHQGSVVVGICADNLGSKQQNDYSNNLKW